MLPDGWWRDAEHLRAEVEKHGSCQKAAIAHGLDPSTLTKWWRKLELPPLREDKLDERDILDPARLREQQQKAELAHLRREVERLHTELAAREAVIERIIEAGRVPVDVPKYTVARANQTKHKRSAIAPIFDIQYGQLVAPSDTPLNVGDFNTAVFDQRLSRWLEAVTGSIRDYAASHTIDEFVLPLGGDLVEGSDIFAGQPWQLELDPARQVVELKEKLAGAISTLIGFLKEEIGTRRIMIVAVPGNHGKVGGKRSGATPSTMSWDWLCTEWLKDRLREEPIDVWGIEPGGALLFETAKRLFLLIHGDEIKGWGGLPFYGMTRYDGRAMRLTGEVYDYCLMGHHHQPASIPNGSGGEFIVSGDWVGANNLARNLGAASTPQQRLLFVSAKYGITENLPIYLAPPKRERPRIYTASTAA